MDGGPLTASERAELVALYEARLARFGHDHRTVGWGTREDQLLRFDMLCRDLPLAGRHVLDVGCGLGDLVPYLERRTGGDFTYTGIEMSTQLVARAQEAFGGARRRFITGDFATLDLAEQADLVFMSGTLSFRVADNAAFARAMIERGYACAREALAVNFLTSYVDWQEDKNFHYAPEEMLKLAKSLTRHVALYHDYPLWEFTLQLRRAPGASFREADPR